MDLTALLPKATVRRVVLGFELAIQYGTGAIYTSIHATVKEAKNFYEDQVAEDIEGLREMEAERAAERLADAYWEEGPASFRDLRWAEQMEEDRRAGSLF